MAFASLFTLLDDITAVLDDVAMMTKVAAKKTAGVVGDDLALNANQVTGVSAERELPIIWAVAKGSLVNKLILVPLALLLSAFVPALITPLLMIGGVYLCFEGVEKLLHKFLHRNEHEDGHDAEPEVTDEKTKVKGAVRTDFILSAEIIIIALGVVEKYDLMTRSLVMAAIGVGMTALVYGLVGIIVKLDDLGMMLMRQKSVAVQGIGRGLISFMPWFMRGLSIVGTLAMFLVGGGIVVHGIAPLHHAIEHFAGQQSAVVAMILPTVLNLILGFIIGGIVVLGVKAVAKIRGQAH